MTASAGPLEAFTQADHALLDEVFRATARELAMFARKLPPGRISPEDLVQEAFEAAVVRWSTFRALGEEERRRWLYAVVHNKSIDSYRKYGRVVPLDLEADAPTLPGAVARDRALDAIVAAQCWQIVQQMPLERRRVAHLRWWGEWTSREIADCLGIAQSTVRGHLKLARDEIVSRLGNNVHVDDFDEDADVHARGRHAPPQPPADTVRRPRVAPARETANAEGRRTDGN